MSFVNSKVATKGKMDILQIHDFTNIITMGSSYQNKAFLIIVLLAVL